MALRAGYYGIKKAFKDSIEAFISSMSDALIIKSLDDTLELSDDGELSIDIDNEPTEDSINPVSSGGVYEALQDVSTFSKDLLYGSAITYPASALSDYSLTKDNESVDIKDYDEIVFITGWTTDDVYCVEEWHVDAKILDSIPTATADKDLQFVFPVNAGTSGGGQWVRVSKGSTDDVIHVRTNGTVGIYRIYGIKF